MSQAKIRQTIRQLLNKQDFRDYEELAEAVGYETPELIFDADLYEICMEYVDDEIRQGERRKGTKLNNKSRRFFSTYS